MAEEGVRERLVQVEADSSMVLEMVDSLPALLDRVRSKPFGRVSLTTSFLLLYTLLECSLCLLAMITCQWFFTALSVLPGKSLAIMARRQREHSSRVYRRRKLVVNETLLPKGLNLTLSNNNAGSESTISSTIDESASTCTNLSLTPPSSAKVTPPFGRLFDHHGPSQNHHQAFGSLIGIFFFFCFLPSLN